MSESKHTRGPWEAHTAGSTQSLTVSTVERDKYGRRVLAIAKMADYRGPERANAALVAAAPEMYEALHDLLLTDLVGNSSQAAADEYEERRHRARAALAKADGKVAP